MTGESIVNHHQIEESNIVDRYLLGRLPPEEQTQFEEHFVDCQECLDRLETSANFRRAAKAAYVEDAARAGSFVQAGLLGWLIKRSRWQLTALLLATLVVLVVLPATFYVFTDRRVQGEFMKAKQDSSKWQQQYIEQQRLQAAKENLTPEQPLLPEEPRNVDESPRPQTRVPVFALNIVRSADPNSSAPVNTISIPPSVLSVVLALELESDGDVKSYRATILTTDNRIVWTAKDLKPQSRDTLKVTIRSDSIKPNDYQLILEGLTKEGGYMPQGKYSFRVKDLPEYRAKELQQ